MEKKRVLAFGIIATLCLAGCGRTGPDEPVEESKELLTEGTLQQIYPEAEIKSSYFFGDGEAAVVIYEQQGAFFVEAVEHASLEPQRAWNLVCPPLHITQPDEETLCIVGLEIPLWTHERMATDFPEELLIKWKPETGFACSYEQHWVSADQSHTYGYGNGDGIYAVLNEISADESVISFYFGPGTEPEQEEAFYAAVAREPQMMVSFDGQHGEIVLYNVKVSLADGVNGLTLGEDIHVRQEGSNTVVIFTWRESIERYNLSTEYKNGIDPVVALRIL